MKKPRCQTGRKTSITIRRRRRLLIHMTIIMNRWTLKKFLCRCTTPTTILLAVRKRSNSQDQVIPVDTIIRNLIKKMIIIVIWTRLRNSLPNPDVFVKTSK